MYLGCTDCCLRPCDIPYKGHRIFGTYGPDNLYGPTDQIIIDRGADCYAIPSAPNRAIHTNGYSSYYVYTKTRLNPPDGTGVPAPNYFVGSRANSRKMIPDGSVNCLGPGGIPIVGGARTGEKPGSFWTLNSEVFEVASIVTT